MDYNTTNIMQWNCCGIQSRREEIELLIQKFSPVVFCIQETMMNSSNHHRQSFKNYSCYYSSTDEGSGDVGILVKNTHLHRNLPLTTNFQAVAASVTIGKKAYRICSIYIPPRCDIDVKDLDNIKNQLPSPIIFMGDFNAHNPMWGCVSTSPKGRMIEEFIVENDFIIFNSKSPTHYDIFHNSTSIIDLTLCQPSAFLDFTCNVFNNTHGSDHYPIQLILNDETSDDNNQIHHWDFKKADWKTLKNECKILITDDLFNKESDDMNDYDGDKMRIFSEKLLDIASASIP